MTKKRKYLRRFLLALASPFLLFLLVCLFIYLPPIQNYLVRTATEMASEATGMDIHIRRISLRFPLNLVVDETTVTDKGDTLLYAGQLTAKVQLLPLLKKKVELDGLELKEARVNSGALLEGMQLYGQMGFCFLASHGVDLAPSTAIVNEVTLRDTRLTLCLNDTTAVADTTQTEPTLWKVRLQKMALENFDFRLLLPADSMDLQLSLQQAALTEGAADLHQGCYSATRFELKEARLRYDCGALPPLPTDSAAAPKRLDPNHLLLTRIHFAADSLYYAGNDIQAQLKELTLQEQSGLKLVQTSGQLLSNDQAISIPRLRLTTGNSTVELSASMDWAAAEARQTGAIRARLLAEIGKEDMMTLLAGQPETFVRQYPAEPLQLKAGIDGNLGRLQLTQLSLTLPSAFRATATGSIELPLDSLRRKGEMSLALECGQLQFLQALTGGVLLPEGLALHGKASIDGPQTQAHVQVMQAEQERMVLDAGYHLQREAYRAELSVNGLDLHAFLPDDSLFAVHASLQAEGEGTDLFSPRTRTHVEGSLDHLQYGKRVFSGIGLNADLQDTRLTAAFSARDHLIDLTTQLHATLHPHQVVADLRAQADRIDFYGMNLTEKPLKTSQQLEVHMESDLRATHAIKADMTNIQVITDQKTFRTKDLHAGFQTRPDSVKCFVNAGDLYFLFRAPHSLEALLAQTERLTAEMGRQWTDKHIDQPKVRQLLPTTECRLFSEGDNPIANMLSARNHLRYQRLDVHLQTSPEEGLNGNAYLYRLRTDSLELDTLYCEARQDSALFYFNTGVKALAKPWQEAFSIALNSHIGATEAQMTAEYLNGKGQRGAYIGFHANLREKGISLHVVPENPTLVYRTFHANPSNYVYLSDQGRIHADLKLYDGRKTGLSFYSSPDSTAQQDLTLSLHRIDIGELKRIVPYMPDIAGAASLEAHYVQRNEIPTVAAEMRIDQLAYNQEPLGDWEMNAVYLPLDNGNHTVDGYLLRNEHQVASLNGSYQSDETETGHDRLDAYLSLEHFPLSVANAFVPDKMATLTGDMDGTLSVTGSGSRPVLNGELSLDSVSVRVPQASLLLRMDDRKVRIADSHLHFDRYNIYTSGKNPFTIDGDVNLTDLTNPRMDLTMDARNFELINAKRTKDALVYGKLFVDFQSTLKGDLEDLKMRGTMSVLGSSNFTYVMKDSPLEVEDRLNETVTFVNFADTVTTLHPSTLPSLTLGGMDILMTLHIDEAVQARIDLTSSGSNYMLLEGGGDLSFQYKPDGSMLLNGRYSLMSGEMKYEMPIIPLKTFHIKEGSYIEWTGNLMNPALNIQAYERMRASVSEEGQSSRMVSFDVGVNLTNRLENLGFTFTLEAPEDGTVQNELAAMSGEEKNKLAVTMLVTGIYMTENNASGNFNTNSMLNSFLQGQINNIAGSALKTIDLNFGMETNEQEDGSSSTDYNFQFAKRFWNNRFRVVIGGKISSGNNVQQDESFIDNISLEYRLDSSGTRYIKVFHDKNYESILDGEVIETGAGIVLRKKVSKLGELFIFRKKKKRATVEESVDVSVDVFNGATDDTDLYR